MIDFHTHILPGIDDGSPDLETTAGMIREQCSQGTGLIIATPHFYADRTSVSQFLERRHRVCQTTEEWLSKQEDYRSLPQLTVGAEVYYFTGMGRAAALPSLCVSGTETLLLEMPFAQWGSSEFADVKDIVCRQKLTVVLAHIERYAAFQKDRTVWNEIFDLPVIAQINAGSFRKTGGFFRRDAVRRFCLQFLEEHPRSILGSDAHNLTTRRPNLAEGREVISSTLGEEALRAIDETTREVLGL